LISILYFTFEMVTIVFNIHLNFSVY
jgi:hypothetical protein